MARWIVSDGILAFLAVVTAVRRRGFASGSPPPIRAAEVNSRMSLVNVLPRRASTTAFLCLIEAHLECPDILLSFPQSARCCARQLPPPVWRGQLRYAVPVSIVY